MPLEILHLRAKTHENEQFRRVVKIIDGVFKKHNFSGILVGNPFNEEYRRFRADAILLYNYGVVIIDFKDYSGQLIIPRGDKEFKCFPWYAAKVYNHQAVEVKAGAHFLNPFCQLVSYRNAFREIVEQNPILKQKIKTSQLCIANIFSGPLELSNKIPGKYPYYKIIQESEIGALLYDLNNDNAYDEDIEKTIKSIFSADEYIQDYSTDTEVLHKKDIIVGEEAKSTINDFMQHEGNDILIMTSMDASERDNWSKYIISIADNYQIPEVQNLCHSNRIGYRLLSRGIEATSLYSFIYGGNKKSINSYEDENKNESEAQTTSLKPDDESDMQVVPLRRDSDLDERALLIVNDAHLVSRSLSQTDLLRFGSGRLLEDFIAFTNTSSKRKLVFIGDPYMLSWGASSESAINITNLQNICGERVIHHYHQPATDSQESDKEALRSSLAKSIDSQLYNRLDYCFNDKSIIEIDKDGVIKKMKEWFSKPFTQEPKQAILLYKKEDCLKTNLWIKTSCLRNSKDLASGDLLIANNNIFIPKKTDLRNLKLSNGMYFTVRKIQDHIYEEISVKGYPSPVLLSFTKVAVTCLNSNLNQDVEAEIWIFDNYLTNTDTLAKEEQIAIRIFINRKIAGFRRSSPFKNSMHYQRLIEDTKYKALSNEEKSAIEDLIRNRLLDKEERREVSTTKAARSCLKLHYSNYESDIQRQARENDPLVNVLYARYAWAITVHKAIGSEFESVILKGVRTENERICSESYFQWLYSGISTSSGTFYISQPQHIHPLMDCVISKTNSRVSVPKRLLVFESYAIPPRFAGIVRLKNLSVVAAICELAIKLEAKGILLEESKPCNDYQTKAIFSMQKDSSKKLTINICNKGGKKSFGVSSIEIEPNNLVDLNEINTDIESVLSLTPETVGVAKYPEYIADVLRQFSEQLKTQGIALVIIDAKDFQIVCKATSDKGSAMLRLWYGTSLENKTKGFITQIEAFDISDPDIITQIEGIKKLKNQ